VPGRRIETGVIAALQTSALEISVQPHASTALPLKEIPQLHIG